MTEDYLETMEEEFTDAALEIREAGNVELEDQIRVKNKNGYVDGKFHLDGLNHRHRMAIRLYVAGTPIGNIERACGISSGYANKILRSDLAQAEIERLMKAADDAVIDDIKVTREILSSNSPAMAANIVGIALDKDNKPELQLSACAQAIKMAEGGGNGEGAAATFQIMINNKDGQSAVDIFEGAAKLEGEASNQTGRKALEIAGGVKNESENAEENATT